MSQFNARKPAVTVDFIRHHPKVLDVTLIQQLAADPRHCVTVGGDHANFGEDGSEPAFSFHAAVHGLKAGPVRPSAITVWHLPKAVAQGLWPKLDWLKKDVMSGITAHVIAFRFKFSKSLRLDEQMLNPLDWVRINHDCQPSCELIRELIAKGRGKSERPQRSP